MTNEDFLKVVFAEDWANAHVTAFDDDPSDIPNERRALCWGGGLVKDRLSRFSEGENQYFTISTFFPIDEGGRTWAVRRKAQFDACFVIVADDVNEKLPIERVELLPRPTYKLFTSEGSEQWGWVLNTPCEDRDQVENLLDGLVSMGLAPDGIDPGMKGVTRYVRLPGGSNTKAKRLVGGKPFKCYLSDCNPDLLYEIEDLAKVFNIDLYASRASREVTTLGADHPIVKGHPFLKHVTVTDVGNDDWLRIDCVNADAHTGGDASGAAVRVTEEGALLYQCHHGHCLGEGGKGKLTGPKAIEMVDTQIGAGGRLIAEVEQYKMNILARNHDALVAHALETGAVKPSYDVDGVVVDEMGTLLDRSRYIFMAHENCFYDLSTGNRLPTKGLDNKYLQEFPGGKAGPLASKFLLQTLDRETGYADAVGWNPTSIRAPARCDVIYEDGGKRTVNTWRGFDLSPVVGDVSLWLKLAEYLIPDQEEREVVLDYLACVVQRINVKPAYAIMHRGNHRIGKDLFYKGVVKAMGGHCARTVNIENILKGWGDYVAGLKLAIITEVDNAQDHKVANAMKVIIAPSASGQRVLNLKGGSVVTQVDCTANIMMTNKRAAVAIERGDKRYFVVDSWVEPNSAEFYSHIDSWYKSGGSAVVLDYLLSRDISGFDPMILPYMTKGALEMVGSGRYDYEQDLDELINEGMPPFHQSVVTLKDFKKCVKEHGLKGGNNGLEEAMRRLGWLKFRGNATVNGKTVHTPTYFGEGLGEDATHTEAYNYFSEHFKNGL